MTSLFTCKRCKRKFKCLSKYTQHVDEKSCKRFFKQASEDEGDERVIDGALLKRARIILMSEIKKNKYKKLTKEHIVKYPCDKKLLSLLEFFYDEIVNIHMTSDPYQFDNYKVKAMLSSSFREKYKEQLKEFHFVHYS